MRTIAAPLRAMGDKTMAMNRCERERVTKCTNVARTHEPGDTCSECADTPPIGARVPFEVEEKRQRVLGGLWGVAEAARVLQQNVGRTTGPMWSRLDNAMAALDMVTGQ